MLDGQVIVVTGAGRGIGRAIAIKLAEAGAKVVVNDLGVSADGEGSDTNPAAEVAKEISDLGGVAIANHDSVAEWDSAHGIIQAAIDNFGRVDGLVNNAGIVRDNLLLRMKSEEWNRELLKRVQQKAEELRETGEGDDKLQSELEAVQEVYGLSDAEMEKIKEETEKELDFENQYQPSSMEFNIPERSIGLTLSTIMLVIAGLILFMVTPIIGTLFLGGIFIFRLHR